MHKNKFIYDIFNKIYFILIDIYIYIIICLYKIMLIIYLKTILIKLIILYNNIFNYYMVIILKQILKYTAFFNIILNIIKKYIYSTNHKIIGIIYILFGIFVGILAIILSVCIRIELSYPGNQLFLGNTQLYNMFTTLHGLLMLLFVLMPIVFGGMGNILVPILIGTNDMAFPRLNNLSFWLLIPSILLIFIAMLSELGIGTGWTLYPPLSNYIYHSSSSIDLIILSLHLSGISSIISSLNFIITIFELRITPLYLLPLYNWCIIVTSILIIIVMPVLAGAITLLLMDRNFNTSFYNVLGGGDPILFQHLFWFFGHPEVYILVLPIFGIISQIIPIFSNRSIFGKISMIYAIWTIGLIGSIVWAHHMYTVGMNIDSRIYFTVASMVIGIPTGVKIFNWIATMWPRLIEIRVPILFCYGFLILFTLGGLTGLIVANSGIDTVVHDTYYVVAHFHYVLSLGVVFGIFAAFYYWIPKLLGLTYNETLGQIHFWVLFIGVNITFFPMHFLGLMGMPRRISDYPDIYVYWNLISTFGSYISSISLLLLFYIFYDIIYNKYYLSKILTNNRPQSNDWLFYSKSIDLLYINIININIILIKMINISNFISRYKIKCFNFIHYLFTQSNNKFKRLNTISTTYLSRLAISINYYLYNNQNIILHNYVNKCLLKYKYKHFIINNTNRNIHRNIFLISKLCFSYIIKQKKQLYNMVLHMIGYSYKINKYLICTNILLFVLKQTYNKAITYDTAICSPINVHTHIEPIYLIKRLGNSTQNDDYIRKKVLLLTTSQLYDTAYIHNNIIYVTNTIIV